MKHWHRLLISGLVVVALAVALALLAPGGQDSLAQVGIIFVDADAAGADDGTSWDDAFNDLQPALEAAGLDDQIWVAEGIYRPTEESGGTGDRFKSFQMVNGVEIYGGFDPTVGDVAWEDRDWVANPTVLSGDIGTGGSTADNVYHVFFHPDGTNLDGSAVLDGFTITGGNASGDVQPHQNGGGMYNYGSSPTLANCTFAENSAAQDGGGMYNDSGSSPALTNCAFEANTAENDGGGIYNNDGSAPTLTGCVLAGNSVGTGGAGGGMLNNNASPLISSCVFSGNSAAEGGGIFNTASSPTLVNCIFEGNTAVDDGGGMQNDGSSPLLTNCTFTDNAAIRGGAIFNFYSSPTLTNCILWGDTPDEMYSADPPRVSLPVVTYSDVEGGYTGVGNIDADPLFLNAGGDLRLQLSSPAIDVGNSAAPGLVGITTDLGGNPRFAGIVDMGAYEAPHNPIFVDLEAAGDNDGTSWANALTDLQVALAWAQEGVEIWVAAGTYKPTAEHGGTGDRFKSFQMVNGVEIYGGFDPTVGDVAWEDRDWVANLTILSGDIGTGGDPADNVYHVFFHPDGTNLDDSAILDGFTITGGNASGDVQPHQNGGGMYNYGSSPTLANCTFEGNTAADDGGGMYNEDSSPVLTNCTLTGNSVSSGGSGGGMLNNSASPVLSDCIFSGNSADLGGGVFNANSSPTLVNCLFEGNTATYDGGGMQNDNSSPALTNCTFTGNSATRGGAIFNFYSSPTLTNCILWGDTPDEMYSADPPRVSLPVVTYSDVESGYPGVGNIDADPLFVNAGGGDFHLGPGSPCIDTGNNAAPDLPPYDFEGDVRVIDGDRDGNAVADMGIDEARIRTYLPVVLKAY